MDYSIVKDMRAAHALVERYHYSGRAVRNSSVCAVASDDALRAACFFFSPAARWKEPVLELCRLVREPGADVALTKLIAIACNEAKKIQPLLVSMADATHNHHGGVYQAASWNYHGLRSAGCDAMLIDGVLTPRRSCNEKYGTSSFSKLAVILANQGKTCERHFDKGKHLYWRAANKEGQRRAERLGLLVLPYPKPLVDA